MKDFMDKVLKTWGDHGRDWFNQLPSTIQFLSKHWGLIHISPASNLSYHYVAFAFQAKKTPVVLKIGCDKKIIEDEYKALRHFNGVGSVQILDVHHELHALLLEQAMPGELFKHKYSITIEDSIEPYANVVKQIASSPTVPTGFHHASY